MVWGVVMGYGLTDRNDGPDATGSIWRVSLILAFAAAMLPAKREGLAALDLDDGRLPPSMFASQASEILRGADELEALADDRPPGASRAPAARRDRQLPARFVSRYVAKETRRRMPGVSSRLALETARAIVGEANARKLDPLFIMAIIQHESRFDSATLGRHGEIGLMQIKPSTAAWVAARAGIEFRGKQDLLNPVFNVRIGVAYVAFLKSRFRGGGLDYLSAYNMGPSAVRLKFKAGKRPRVYVAKVMEEYLQLRDEALQLRPRVAAQIAARR